MSHHLPYLLAPPRSAWRRFSALAAAVALLLAVGAPSTAEDVAAEEAHELRGAVPTARYLRSQLAELSRKRVSTLEDLDQRHADLEAAIDSLAQLSTADRKLAFEIEEQRKLWWRTALEFFMATGSDSSNPDLSLLSLGLGAPIDNKWNQHLDAVLNRLRQLEAQADASLVAMVKHIEHLHHEMDMADSRLAAIEIRIDEFLAVLVVADAWDRADTAIATGRYGFAPREKWDALRFCESSDDYRAVSPSGKYRGAYQFDRSTWQTVGGEGDPADASAGEQDARARELYARRGAAPWPTCGRYLL